MHLSQKNKGSFDKLLTPRSFILSPSPAFFHMPIPHLPPINPHCHKCYLPWEEEGEGGGKKGGEEEEAEKVGLAIEDNRTVGSIPCHLKCDKVRERERERESVCVCVSERERAREREREREENRF